jgi:hypothetical protein
MTRPEVTGRKNATTDALVLVPDPQVWREFGVTPMTGWRWTQMRSSVSLSQSRSETVASDLDPKSKSSKIG